MNVKVLLKEFFGTEDFKRSRKIAKIRAVRIGLVGEEASQIWVDHFNESLRPEVSPSPGTKSAKDVKTIRPTVEEITKGIPEVIKQWRDTFGV